MREATLESTRGIHSRESPERIRLTVEINTEMKNLIDALVEQTGSSRAEILRRSIALLKTVKDAESSGEYPALIDGDGNVRAKLVGV